MLREKIFNQGLDCTGGALMSDREMNIFRYQMTHEEERRAFSADEILNAFNESVSPYSIEGCEIGNRTAEIGCFTTFIEDEGYSMSVYDHGVLVRQSKQIKVMQDYLPAAWNTIRINDNITFNDIISKTDVRDVARMTERFNWVKAYDISIPYGVGYFNIGGRIIYTFAFRQPNENEYFYSYAQLTFDEFKELSAKDNLSAEDALNIFRTHLLFADNLPNSSNNLVTLAVVDPDALGFHFELIQARRQSKAQEVLHN